MRRAAILAVVLVSPLPALAAPYPPPIAAAVREREKACTDQGGRPAASARFVRRVNLDGDGKDDFIIHDGLFRCTKGTPGFCGSGGCGMAVFLSSARGGLKRVLEETGSGYGVTKARGGARVTFRTRRGPATYRFAGGCAIPVAGGGERRC
jgi:hypothetical protein